MNKGDMMLVPSMEEWEPRTLSLEELKYAREAALYVLSTHSSDDAIRIFTHGLKPVLGIRKNFMDSDDEDDDCGGAMFQANGAFVGGGNDGRAGKMRAPF